ncbi:cell division protein [Salinigranum rubrum]|uniref:Tubulin-like protein CetZ n=1 Tax=Salinigranum rubrum TaxID=755307 RepID=A0A2I8VGF8_9EURY|nr:tubulin/FtsZ family protein [Salinigranum rubrum]AUV81015.1 cell division protein [Salinigranum rubrum]
MQSALIGVGQAGGKLVSALQAFDADENHGSVRHAVAINTASADLRPLPNTVQTLLVGQSRVSGHGVGGDNELGAQVMREDREEVLDTVTIDSATEAVFVVAGLGGGTGSGGAPVLVQELKRVYDVPVYAIGVLPGRDEGAMYQVNAGRSLKTLAREADSVLLVDNDSFRRAGDSLGSGYERINEAIARRLGLLLAAGEVDTGSDVAESVVDASELINTLRNGTLATIGYADASVARDAAENVNVVTSTTRRALLTGTAIEADSADAALVVVAGRPEAIPRKGVERARRWVEEETGCMQVRGGDFPVASEKLASLVLLSGIERTARVESFFERAREAASGSESESDASGSGSEPRESAADQWAVDELDDLT